MVLVALLGIAILAVALSVAYSFHGPWRKRLAIAVLCVGPAAAVAGALFGANFASANHMNVLITASTTTAGAGAIPLTSLTYDDAMTALTDAETAGDAKILLDPGFTGLPSLSATEGTATNDDTTFTVVVRGGNVSMFGTTASVLLSATWEDADTDSAADIAVLIKFDSVGLGSLNSAFTQFPVTVNSAIVGIANADQTLDPAALGAEDFFTDGIPVAGVQGTLGGYDVKSSGVSFSGGVTGGVISEATGVLGAGGVKLSGSLSSGNGLESGGSTVGLDISATVTTSTPDSVAAKGITLEGDWTLNISAVDSTYSARILGDMQVDAGDGPIDVTGSLGVSYNSADQTATFDFSASVGAVNDLGGLTWLDLTGASLDASLTKSAGGVDISASISAGLSIGNAPNQVTGTATFAISKSGGATTTQLSLDVTNSVSAKSFLTTLGASYPDVAGWDVTISNLGLDVTLTSTSTTKTFTLAVTAGAQLFGGPGCEAGDPDFDPAIASVLFRLASGAPTKPFLISGYVSGLTLKQLSCDAPFDWTLPTVAVTLSNSVIDLDWDLVDAPTITHFSKVLCPGATDVCPSRLEVAQGLTIDASITLDGDVEDALAEIGVTIDGPLVVSGTLPIMGGTAFGLEVSLPAILGGADDIVKSGIVSLAIAGDTGQIGVEVSGDIVFRVQRPDQTTCSSPASDGTFSNGKCFDELTLTVTAGISATTTPPGIELFLQGRVDNWNDAFGLSVLDINRLVLQLTIGVSATDGVTVELAMLGDLTIGTTDLTLAFQLEVGLTPPRIVLEGLTVGSSKGLALRDVVSVLAPSANTASIPDLSLKNLWFAYGTEANPDLCIMQGFYVSAELHINASDTDTVGNPICGTTITGNNSTPRTCSDSDSCIAGLQISLSPSGFTASGSIAAFDLGPINFSGLEVAITMNATTQSISFAAGATLYDPIAYYANPGGSHTVWASGYLAIGLSQSAGVFQASVDGCAVIGGDTPAAAGCPDSATALLQMGVEGSLTLDITKLGTSLFTDGAEVDLTFTLNAAGLTALAEEIEEAMVPVAAFFDDAGVAITGTTTDIIDQVEAGFCDTFPSACGPSFTATAEDYDNAADYLEAAMDATESEIGTSSAVGTHCFFTNFYIEECRTALKATARTTNEAFIAAQGGAEYIALHGIEGEGYAGLVIGCCRWIPNTYFSWPAAGELAPCDVGGVLAGTSVCDIAIGQPIVAADIVGPVLYTALQELDPSLAALFASGQLETGAAAQAAPAARSAAAAAAAPFDNEAFMNTISAMAAEFDPNAGVSVCAATTTYTWNGTDGDEPTPVDLAVKTDTLGAKVDMTMTTTTGGDISVDQIQEDIVTEALTTALTDLSCPVAGDSDDEATVAYSMSASSIDEGSSLTLTGTAGATVTVNWGDGSTATTVTADGAGAWTASHTYVDGPKNHIISATSGTAIAQSVINVKNVAPVVTGVAATASIDEGGTFTVTGTVTDAGVLDTPSVVVNWGDGTSSPVTAVAANGSFSLSHLYADDNPTFTTSDKYTVTVTARDKDKATAMAKTTLTVANVAPHDITLAATTLLGPVPADTAGRLIVPEGVEVTFNGTAIDPGVGDTIVVSVDMGDDVVPPDVLANRDNLKNVIATRDTVDPTLVRFTFTHTFADDHPATATASDVLNLRVSVADDDSGLTSIEPGINVVDVAPTVAASPITQEVQYSDSMATLTFTATDVAGYTIAGARTESLTAATRWQLNGGAWQTGLPADFAFTPGSCTITGTGGAARRSCTWTVGGRANVAPGIYTIEFRATDDDTLSTATTANIVVRPEDARVAYIGPVVASSAADPTQVELRATVRDISIVPGIVPPDLEPGDITKSTVTFVNRATGATLCTAPVTQMFAGNTTTGVAACTATMASSATPYLVGSVVGGWYIRNDAADDTLVTIRRPNIDSLHGNHWIVATGGVGTLPPTTGTRVTANIAHLGLTSNLAQYRGTYELLFTSGGRQYKATVTSVHTLGVLRSTTPTTNVADLVATATLLDVTDPKRPVTVATGLRLAVRYVDDSSPSTPDTMTYGLWQPSGILVSAANWDGVRIKPLTLAGGQLLIK